MVWRYSTNPLLAETTMISMTIALDQSEDFGNPGGYERLFEEISGGDAWVKRDIQKKILNDTRNGTSMLQFGAFESLLKCFLHLRDDRDISVHTSMEKAHLWYSMAEWRRQMCTELKDPRFTAEQIEHERQDTIMAMSQYLWSVHSFHLHRFDSDHPPSRIFAFSLGRAQLTSRHIPELWLYTTIPIFSAIVKQVALAEPGHYDWVNRM